MNNDIQIGLSNRICEDWKIENSCSPNFALPWLRTRLLYIYLLNKWIYIDAKSEWCCVYASFSCDSFIHYAGQIVSNSFLFIYTGKIYLKYIDRKFGREMIITLHSLSNYIHQNHVPRLFWVGRALKPTNRFAPKVLCTEFISSVIFTPNVKYIVQIVLEISWSQHNH